MPGVTSLSLVSGYESDSSTSSTHHDAVVDEDLQVTAVTPAPTRLADPRAAGTAGAATPSARQSTIAAFFSPASNEVNPQQQRAKQKRAEQRRKKVHDAAANPTAPARAEHIDKARVVRSHAQRTAARCRGRPPQVQQRARNVKKVVLRGTWYLVRLSESRPAEYVQCLLVIVSRTRPC